MPKTDDRGKKVPGPITVLQLPSPKTLSPEKPPTAFEAAPTPFCEPPACDTLKEAIKIDDSDLLIGRTIQKYKLLKLLGKGGMGAVYLAELADNPDAPKIAVKILSKDENLSLETTKGMRDRFFEEAAAVMQLHHSNIVEGLAFGEFDDHRLFIAMEYLKGKNLAEHIKNRGMLGFEEIVRILIQICDGMQAAHDRKILHRDLKLENIFILDDGTVKIVDLGLAKSLRPEVGHPTTQEGKCIGTPQYMSPELCEARDYGNSVDIYATGVSMYYMLCKSFPFDGDTPISILLKHIKEPVEPPNKRLAKSLPKGQKPNIPKELEDIVMHALKKDPGKRFRSMDEFRTALIIAATANDMHTGITKQDIDLPKPVPKNALLSRAGIAMIASAALLAISATAFFVLRPSEENAKKEAGAVQTDVVQVSVEQDIVAGKIASRTALDAQDVLDAGLSDAQQDIYEIQTTDTVPQIPESAIVQLYITRIKTNPPGALVEICETKDDGTEWKRNVGETPIQGMRLDKKAVIVLSHPGYYPAFIEIAPDNNAFDIALKKIPDNARR